MILASPFWLLALPALAAGAWLLRRGGGLATTLPGQWDRLIDPALRGPLARRLGAAGGARWRPALAAAALTALALAHPVIDAGGAPAHPDLVGRVLVIETAKGVDPGPQRRLAERLLAPGAPPTALVAAAGEGYDVVPLTEDRAHLGRYLAVLSDAVMPEHGRRPAAGLAHAEATLARAGTVVGQTVFLPAAPPPPEAAPPAARSLRVVLAHDDALHRAWRETAGAWGARLAGPDDLGAVRGDLEAALAEEAATGLPGGATDLRPWLAGAAAACWLALFRRRAEA
ncbi:MAG: hypothetical protein R6V44_07170 [Paracoccaceae bacterium]